MDSPQQLLDQIHATGIFALDARKLPAIEDRVEQAKRIRQQLREIRARVQAAVQSRRVKGANRQLAPYEYLDEMLDKLEYALREFLTDPTTKIPYYGTVFYGDPRTGEWYLGTPEQARTWKLERREQELAQQFERLQSALEETRRKLKTNRRQSAANRGVIRGAVFCVLALVLIVAGVALALAAQNPVFLLAGLIGLLPLIVGVIGIARWNRRRRQLEAQARTLRAQGRALTAEMEVISQQHQEVVRKLLPPEEEDPLADLM
ncbi:MAG TPA: hypothetical protein VKY59_16485 [Spirillospora sp.]|nr:hypothetical protein [Spirillospora sp.]